MRSLILTPSAYPLEVGGAQLHTYYLAKVLQKKGHTMTVLTTGNTESCDVIDDVYFKVVKVPRKPLLFSVFAFFKYFRELLRFRPDFVLIDLLTTGLSESAVLVINILQGIPYLITVHGVEVKKANFLIKFFQSIVFFRAKYIVAVSAELARRISTEYLVPYDKIHIIPNCYCNSEIEKIKRRKKKSNKMMKDIVFVGRLAPEKDLLTLIKAIRIVLGKGIDVKLNIIGNGPLFTELKSFCIKNGLSSNIRFLGRVDHHIALEHIFDSDMLVLPSVEEGLPTVLIEAMALGKPVIATNVGAIRELINSGENGLIVPPRSPKALASAIVQLMKDAILAKSLSINATHTVKFLTLDYVSKRYEELLRMER